MKAKLLTHRRIKEVLINSEFSWWKDDYQEFYFNLNKERMAQEGIDAQVLFSAVRPIFLQESGDWFGSCRAGNGENQALFPPVCRI